MVETAIATWTTAAIAGILPLHACPARVGHGVDAEPPSLRSAPCLPLESSKLLRATQAGSQPDADQRNSNISSASAARLRPLCSPGPTMASDPVGIRRRIDAGLDRHRHQTQGGEKTIVEPLDAVYACGRSAHHPDRHAGRRWRHHRCTNIGGKGRVDAARGGLTCRRRSIVSCCSGSIGSYLRWLTKIPSKPPLSSKKGY
jgi:hypothetical protein